ncbi:MAG: hypothetical protein LBJ67_17115, partial [Planctomycetaceae bacterium]|nr:hypothetical protein [Planctomycetaceae bacterium]
MKKFFLISTVILILSSFGADKIFTQELTINSKLSNPVLTSKVAEAQKRVAELTPDVNSEKWIDLQSNQSPENFETLSHILHKYEAAFQSITIQTDNTFFEKRLISMYRFIWFLLLKYADNDDYRQKITDLWKTGIPPKGIMCIEFTGVDWKNIISNEEIMMIKNEAWRIIETTSTLPLFDSFCHILMNNNPTTRTSFGNADDLKKLEKICKRIDTSTPAGKRALDVAHYSCAIMRYYTDPTYGTPSRILQPLTYEELLELGPIVYLDEAVVKAREDAIAKHKADIENAVENGIKLSETKKGRLEILKVLTNPKEDFRITSAYYDAIFRYYESQKRKYLSKNNEKEPEENDLVTPEEVAMFFEVYHSDKSNHLLIKSRAAHLIFLNHCKSLIPKILEMTTLDELALADAPNDGINPNDPNYKPPKKYHYAIFGLLGGLGDETTCKQLQNLIDSKTFTCEKKEDAELAIENIQKRLAYEKEVEEQRESMKKQFEADIASGKAIATEGHGDATESPFFIQLPEYNPNRPKPTPEEQRKAREYELLTCLPRPFRYWKSVDGFTCRARLLEIMDGNKVKLGHSIGEQYQIIVDTDRLSDEDKEYIKTWTDIQKNGEPAELKFRTWIWNFPSMGTSGVDSAIYVTTTQDNIVI